MLDTRDHSVKDKILPDALDILMRQGWTVEDYYIEKVYKGYPITIEFNLHDYCVGLYAKKGMLLLEHKIICRTFFGAFARAAEYEARIDRSEHWRNEEY